MNAKLSDIPDPAATSSLSEALDLPSTLYHYTTQQGLLGIIQSKSIWATDLLYLNDATEYVYGLEIIKKVLQEQIKSIPCTIPTDSEGEDDNCEPEPVEERKKEYFFIQKLLSFLTFFENARNSYPYVSSFTTKADDLSQWRAYAGKNGFCIGFDTRVFQKMMATHHFLLENCLYFEKEQRDVITTLLSDCIVVAKNEEPEPESENPLSLMLNQTTIGALVFFLQLIPRLKHWSFIDEDEWRFIRTGSSANDKIKVRQGISMLVPYIEVPLANEGEPVSVIKEIIVGPTPHGELSLKSVKKMLDANSVKCEVYLSNIPYRTW